MSKRSKPLRCGKCGNPVKRNGDGCTPERCDVWDRGDRKTYSETCAQCRRSQQGPGTAEEAGWRLVDGQMWCRRCVEGRTAELSTAKRESCRHFFRSSHGPAGKCINCGTPREQAIA